jgi:hypothetical protein
VLRTGNTCRPGRNRRRNEPRFACRPVISSRMCYARDRTKPPFVATQIVDPSKGKIGGEVASRRWPRNSPDPSSSDAQLIELVSAMLTRLHSPSGALTPHLASPPNPSPSDARVFPLFRCRSLRRWCWRCWTRTRTASLSLRRLRPCRSCTSPSRLIRWARSQHFEFKQFLLILLYSMCCLEATGFQRVDLRQRLARSTTTRAHRYQGRTTPLFRHFRESVWVCVILSIVFSWSMRKPLSRYIYPKPIR